MRSGRFGGFQCNFCYFVFISFNAGSSALHNITESNFFGSAVLPFSEIPVTYLRSREATLCSSSPDNVFVWHSHEKGLTETFPWSFSWADLYINNGGMPVVCMGHYMKIWRETDSPRAKIHSDSCQIPSQLKLITLQTRYWRASRALGNRSGTRIACVSICKTARENSETKTCPPSKTCDHKPDNRIHRLRRKDEMVSSDVSFTWLHHTSKKTSFVVWWTSQIWNNRVGTNFFLGLFMVYRVCHNKLDL